MNEYLEEASINISCGVIGGCIVLLFDKGLDLYLISLVVIFSLIITTVCNYRGKRLTKNKIPNGETEKWKNYF